MHIILVMQFLVTYIAVYNVLVVSGPTIEKKCYLPYHIVHVIFSYLSYWSGPRVMCVCAQLLWLRFLHLQS